MNGGGGESEGSSENTGAESEVPAKYENPSQPKPNDSPSAETLQDF